MLFICAKDRGSRVTGLHFIAIFAKCSKRKIKAPVWHKKKKMKKLKQTFERSYPANGYCKFNQICCVACPTWRTVVMQKLCALEKGPWSYAHVKKLFSFFLLIYSRCGVPAFLTA